MVSDIDLIAAFAALPAKPDDGASRESKQRYSQLVSDATALVIARSLVERGLRGTCPVTTEGRKAGAERRLAGGIGAKRVDVSWATEESGLLLGVSVKSINFRDSRTRNYQKNLTNRRGDLLIEAVTLHRRFPYAVLGGLFILDAGAADDATGRRKSTFENAGYHLRLFRGRRDPAGREEQFEELILVLLDANGPAPSLRAFAGTNLSTPTTIDAFLDGLLETLAERNSDFYELLDGRLIRR